MNRTRYPGFAASWFVCAILVAGCGSSSSNVRPASEPTAIPDYVIGPGDTLNVFVWRNPDLTVNVQVRPDGKISVPLVEDMVAVGKSPTQLANDLEVALGAYVLSPNVTVMVQAFGVGAYGNQVRVVGQGVAAPQTIPYREGLTVLDVLIQVGLSEFAAGNRATLVRNVGGEPTEIRLHLNDLIERGELSENIRLQPGDVVIIPQARF